MKDYENKRTQYILKNKYNKLYNAYKKQGRSYYNHQNYVVMQRGLNICVISRHSEEFLKRLRNEWVELHAFCDYVYPPKEGYKLFGHGFYTQETFIPKGSIHKIPVMRTLLTSHSKIHIVGTNDVSVCEQVTLYESPVLVQVYSEYGYIDPATICQHCLRKVGITQQEYITLLYDSRCAIRVYPYTLRYYDDNQHKIIETKQTRYSVSYKPSLPNRVLRLRRREGNFFYFE